jgi:predicted Zn-dependent peptidase
MSIAIMNALKVRAHIVVLALTCMGLTSTVTAAASVKVPAYERVQLDNGAVLLLMERHDVPMISVQAVVRGGAVTDPAGQSGMASLLADLLGKGAGKRDAQAFASTLASVGGLLSAAAGTEATVVSGSFMARDQKLMVGLLADMLMRPTLDAAQFEAQRTRDIESIRAAKDSELRSLAPVYGKAALFGNHPYGKAVMGSESGLAAIDRESLVRHYREQFGADRLIIAVAGDFRTADMKSALSSAFTGWGKASAVLPAVPVAEHHSGRRVVLIDAPESVQSYFWAGNVGVARSFAQRAPLDVVNTLFGGRFTSMLNSELRIRTGLSYGAGSRFEKLSEPGAWAMSSFTRTETTIEAIDLALSVLDKLHAAALEPAMLDSGKSYVRGQFPLALETPDQWADTLADLEFYRLDRSYIDGYDAALAAVSATDAQKMIREVFPASTDLTLVVIGQAAAIRDGLKKYGPVTEMKLADATFSTTH